MASLPIPANASVEDRVRFWINVYNNGLAPLSYMNVTDFLPHGLDFDGDIQFSCSDMPPGYDTTPIFWGDESKNLSWEITEWSLNPLTSLHIYFFVNVSSFGEHGNYAAVIGEYDGFDPVFADDTVTINVIEE